MTTRIYGWCSIIVLLAMAAYCAFQIKNPFVNALFDIGLAFAGFYVGQKDADQKNESLSAQLQEQQDHIEELLERVKQLEALACQAPDAPKPASNVLWDHAIKR